MPALWPRHDRAQANYSPTHTERERMGAYAYIKILTAVLASCPIFAESLPEWKARERHTSESCSSHTSQPAQSSSSCNTTLNSHRLLHPVVWDLPNSETDDDGKSS